MRILKARMTSWLPQVLGFVVQGSTSGWWGLACPAHCQGGLVLPALAFLAGLSSGVVLCLYFLRDTLFPSATTSPPPVPPAQVSVPRASPASLRLRGYLHE